MLQFYTDIETRWFKIRFLREQAGPLGLAGSVATELPAS
jgi:hypothetical protein